MYSVDTCIEEKEYTYRIGMTLFFKGDTISKKKYVWNINEKENYINTLCLEEEALSNLTADIAYCGTKGEVDQSIRMFLQLIYKICDPLYGKTTRKTSYFAYLFTFHIAKTYGNRETPRGSTKNANFYVNISIVSSK